ncbi:hypothetical protein QEA29_004521 [Salmonella enterica]|nr:hypothetical protein [Salmonella enterica]EJI6516229.1 hypothetical protein [Salmonella enterica]EJI6776212.1 hypothetical protein [Salmonella enterica]EJK2460282.1 hypothetical protein [Salmonella enterica]EKT1261553.1 hypothetical protein [Salmonella enterica]
MKSWKRKNQRTGVICLNIVLLLILVNISPLWAKSMDNIKYLFSFQTRRSGCMVRVNNIPIIDNFTYSTGTISTGGNITSFVENGENSVEVMMGPVDQYDNNTLYPDSECILTITRDTINTSQHVTTMKLSVDNDKKIVASLSSNYDGLHSEGRISESQTPFSKEQNLHRISRDVNLSDLPEWAWVKATPVSEKDLPAIKEVYTTIWKAMHNRDIDALKKMTAISGKEMGQAEGITADLVFSSYGLSEKLQDTDLSIVDLSWKEKELVTYCDGRLFRLATGIYQNSPLKLKNKDGKTVFTYNPYLSIINGKIVIVR